jgi:hypothetical protein
MSFWQSTSVGNPTAAKRSPSDVPFQGREAKKSGLAVGRGSVGAGGLRVGVGMAERQGMLEDAARPECGRASLSRRGVRPRAIRTRRAGT